MRLLRVSLAPLVYILTDKRTFSAGEEFAYDLQQQKRATIVGESTTGGAHPYQPQPLIAEGPESKRDINSQFVIDAPNATSINPISKTNWEDGNDKGVQPKIRVPAKNALQTVLSLIQSNELKATTGSAPDTNQKPSVVSSQSIFLKPKSTDEEDTIANKNQDGDASWVEGIQNAIWLSLQS